MLASMFIHEANTVSIREARLSDAQALLELATRTYYETFAPLNTPENMRAYMSSAFTPSQFEADLRDPSAIFLLVEIDGKLGGYAKLRASEIPACIVGEAPVELVRFYVDQPWHGSGVASKMMQACLGEAQRRGFRTVYLGV